MTKGQLTIVLPGVRSPSQNDYWSTPHWAVRAKLAKGVHAIVQKRLREMGIQPGTTCNKKVTIDVVGYFDSRPLDSDNVAVKPFIDGLKGWLLVDDSPKYVGRVSTDSRIDKANPRVEITLTEVE